jgi:hypothetical protein
LKWFKHFTNASDSVRLNKLIDELGVEGYGRYWLLLELIAEESYDGSEEIEVHLRKISAKVQIKFRKKLETFLQKLSDYSLIEFKSSEKVYKIRSLILSELQDKHSKYNRKRVVSNDQDTTYKNKKKNKTKNKNKSIYITAHELMLFWNEQDLKKVNEDSPNALREIQESYQSKEKHGTEKVKQAFVNYAEVLSSPETYYTHKFSCAEFLRSEKTLRFFPGEYDFQEYLSSQNIKQFKTKAQMIQDNLINMENPYAEK